jgi:hypothetical protein
VRNGPGRTAVSSSSRSSNLARSLAGARGRRRARRRIGRSVQWARFVDHDVDLKNARWALRPGLAAPSPGAGFRVGFVGRDRAEQRLLLTDAAGYAFEHVAPVRSFPSFRGQRNTSQSRDLPPADNTGWWCATNPRHVGFESLLERDHVVRLDFAPELVGACLPAVLADLGQRRSRPTARPGLLRAPRG